MVTGGTGFLGSHTVKALVEAGHDLRLLVRSPDKTRTVLDGFDLEVPEYVVGDITDRGSVEQALVGCDAAIHIAALVALKDTDEDTLVRTNLEGTRTVLGAAVDHGCQRVVHVSSSAALFPFQTDPVTSDHPIGSMKGGYGRSKAAAEEVAREFQSAGAPLTIVYPTGIIGPQSPDLNETLGAAQFWVAKSTPASDDMTVGLVDVRDVADILVAALEPDGGSGWRRYLAWGHLATMNEIGLLLRDITGRNISMPRVPKPAMQVWGRLGDVAGRFGKDLTLTSEGARYLYNFVDADQGATLEELRISYRPLRDTMRDMYRWMHDEGYVTADQIGMLAA